MYKAITLLSTLLFGGVIAAAPVRLDETGPQLVTANAQAQVAQNGMIDGEVRKVDMSAGKITIKHGPIPKYDMATAMTMVFQARDPSLLNGLNVGDKVLFDVEKEGGSLTVTQIKKAN